LTINCIFLVFFRPTVQYLHEKFSLENFVLLQSIVLNWFLFQINMAAKMTSTSPRDNYDVSQISEEDFEKLAVYIVPDVPCERGTANRAEKTLPRSLTLKPSLVLSTPTTPVSYFSKKLPLTLFLF
jgi:hypothetical protein